MRISHSCMHVLSILDASFKPAPGQQANVAAKPTCLKRTPAMSIQGTSTMSTRKLSPLLPPTPLMWCALDLQRNQAQQQPSQ